MKKLIMVVIIIITTSAASAQSQSFEATAIGARAYARNIMTYSFQNGWQVNVTKASVMCIYADAYGQHVVNAILDYNDPVLARTGAIVEGTRLMISVRPQNIAAFGYTDGNVGAAPDDVSNCYSGQVISILR